MKKILLALLVIGCKKEEPTPIVMPVLCPTADTSQISGTYRTTHRDSFSVVFLKNNCPTENENYYLLVGFANTMQKFLKPGRSLPVKTYTVLIKQHSDSGTVVGEPESSWFSFQAKYHDGDRVFWVDTQYLFNARNIFRRDRP